MAPILSTPQHRPLWWRTYRFFTQHIRSTFFLLIVIFTIVNIFLNISFDFMRSKPKPPAEPVERRPIGVGIDSMMLQGGKEKGGTPFPAWKARWLQDQELDDNLGAEALGGGVREGIVKEIQEEAGRRLDIVYTWVNGTDVTLKEVKEKYKETSELFLYFKNVTQNQTRSPRLPPLRANGGNRREGLGFDHEPPVVGNGKGDQTIHRFRDNNELKYSLRSIAEYIPEGMLGRVHILTTEVPDNRTEGGLVGQVPEWLDLEKVEKGGGKVRLVKHREIYDDTSVLPSFNSLSIESQMHHVPDLADSVSRSIPLHIRVFMLSIVLF
jgi:hypothetical protein